MRDHVTPEIKGQNSLAGKRDNNFAIVRLMAAVFVFFGHMGKIVGGTPPLLGSLGLQEYGVGALFLISGYLITKSWLSDSHPLRYAIRRFFRLWPPFAVMVVLIMFVAGPLLSELGVEGYFQSEYHVFLLNLRFFIIYSLPGVFTNIPLSDTMNGSMWTMPVEAALYVLTPIFLTIFRVKYRSKTSFYSMSVLTAAALGFDVYLRAFHSGERVVFYATELISAYHLIVLYLIGILFTYEEIRKLLNIQVGCMAMCLLLFVQYSAGPIQYLVMYIVFPYFIFSLIFTKNPAFSFLDNKMELSYGIYLYGFFFQQLMVYFQGLYGWNFSFMGLLILSAIPTVIASILSYYFVEKPCMRFSSYLVKKLKK